MGAVIDRARPRIREAIATRLKDAGIPLLGALDLDGAREDAGSEGRPLPLDGVAECVDSIIAVPERTARSARERPAEAISTRIDGTSRNGHFSDRQAAERAVHDLIESHFAADGIGAGECQARARRRDESS